MRASRRQGAHGRENETRQGNKDHGGCRLQRAASFCLRRECYSSRSDASHLHLVTDGPAPFFVAARKEDAIFPRDGIEETLTPARHAYQTTGATDRLITFFEAGGHELWPTMRGAAYSWLDRWLAPTQ